MAAEGSRSAVVAAFIGNSAIAIAKFIAAGISGSAAMLSEGFHSVADVGNQGLLLRGLSTSQRPATAVHPCGRGPEVYFWSFMVAVMLFVGGAVLAFQHGLEAVRHPHPVESPVTNFVVLGLAIVIEAFTFRVAYKAFQRIRGTRSWWSSIRSTKDSAVLVVLLEDAAAMAGLVVALVGLLIANATGNPVWDGVASLVIALILATVAVILAIETKALLIGEAASRADRAAIRSTVLAFPEVDGVGRLMTMQLGPEEVLVNIEVDLAREAGPPEQLIDRVESAIREVIPAAKNIFVELEAGARG